MKLENTANSHQKDFNHIVSLIQSSPNQAFAKVNEELINLYYNVGEFVSKKLKMLNGEHRLLII